MRSFLRKFRSNIADGSLKGYLLYAIGEITLVVVGILIAVSINNWNEERKLQQSITGALSIIHQELAADTVEANRILEFYEERRSTYDLIINGADTVASLSECEFCLNLLTSHNPINVEKNGLQMLNRITEGNQELQNDLIHRVFSFYTNTVGRMEKSMRIDRRDLEKNLDHLRSEIPWFSEVMGGGRVSKELAEYVLRSDDYRNRVALRKLIMYGNYLRDMKRFVEGSRPLLRDIEEGL